MIDLRHPYLRRCDRLRDRGLSESLTRRLKDVGDMGLLSELEALSDADLARLNRVDEERDWFPHPREAGR